MVDAPSWAAFIQPAYRNRGHSFVGCSGLRYDDLFDQDYDTDVKEALRRLPQEVVDNRNARLKRAMDYGMKHVYMPKDLQVCTSFCRLKSESSS